MPYPIIDLPNIFELRLNWDWLVAGGMINVLHCPGTTGAYLDVAASVHNAFVDAQASAAGEDYADMLVNEVALTSIDVTELSYPDYPSSTVTNGAGFMVGVNTGFALPPQNAVVVTLSTGQARRRGRGRIYTGGFSTGLIQSNGRMLEGERGKIEAYWQQVSTSLAEATDTNALGVLSRGWIRDASCDVGDTHGICRASFDPQFHGAANVEVRDLQVDTMRSRVS